MSIMKSLILASAIIVLNACSATSPDVVTQSSFPTDKSILFWPADDRSIAFRQMELLAPADTVASGERTFELKRGEPLMLEWSSEPAIQSLDSYIKEQGTAGILVLHQGNIRMETYALDFSQEQRWTSFSVAKSLTSTLLGVAVKQGLIDSLDDELTKYLPELTGSGYDGVTIEQLLTMQSGVSWNENYADPQSDVALFAEQRAKDGVDPTIAYMKTRPRELAPGTRWQYNTGETNLIGALVMRVTNKSLSTYLSETIWQPFGMQSDAFWLLNQGEREMGGCCISATLADYARFGLFVLSGGVVNGESIVPEGWFALAGTKRAEIGRPGFGYGYQWWTYDDGSFAAQGIFGQGIFIDLKRELVIASNSNWPVASGDALKQQRNAFYRLVQTAIDQESMARK